MPSHHSPCFRRIDNNAAQVVAGGVIEGSAAGAFASSVAAFYSKFRVIPEASEPSSDEMHRIAGSEIIDA